MIPTLAYNMAYFEAERNGEKHIGLRKHFPLAKIKEEQVALQKFKVAIFPEVDDYELYFLEVYAAGKWKTKWNTFKTH